MMRASLLTILVLFVLESTCQDLDQDDITNYITWYRLAHGAGNVQHTKEYSAFLATQQVCNSDLQDPHDAGPEAGSSSLHWASGDCEQDQEQSELAALKYWYSECGQYTGPGSNFQSTGHFTHLVDKTITDFGIWSMSCPRTNKCITAFYAERGFGGQIDNIGFCTDIQRPWENPYAG